MNWRALLGLLGIVVCGATLADGVTMDEYLSSIRQRHPYFAKESMQKDVQALARDRLLGGEDWVLQSSPYIGYQRPIANNTFTPEDLWSAGAGATLERAFWRNGARLSLSWSTDFIDQNLPGIQIPGPGGTIDVPLGPSTFYENRLFATYSYPLLQNRGGVLDRLQYDLGDFGVRFAAIQALENQEGFLLDIAIRFVDWALISEEARIARARLSFEEEQLQRAQRKRKANLVDEVDVLREEDAAKIATLNVVGAESRLKAKQAELAVLARDEGMYEAVPDYDLYRRETLPDMQESVAKLREQRIVRSLRVRADQVRAQQAGLEQATKPQLSLDLRGGLQEGDDSFGGSWGLDKPDVSVSLGFRYPLGNRAASTDVQKSRLELRQLEMEIETVSLDLEARLRSTWIQIRDLETVLTLNREQIDTARRKTEEEQRRYNQGRGELALVIQSRDSEALAELTHAMNAASYQKLVLSYRALIDDLLRVE